MKMIRVEDEGEDFFSKFIIYFKFWICCYF